MLDIAFSASIVTSDNISGFIDFMEKDVFAGAMHQATDFILDRTVRASETYGFTDRTPRLRPSIQVEDEPVVSRSQIILDVTASAVNPKDGYNYARIIEFGYGGQYSYLRRARDEGAAIFDSLVGQNVREYLQSHTDELRRKIQEGRKKNLFFRDSRGRFAKISTALR